MSNIDYKEEVMKLCDSGDLNRRQVKMMHELHGDGIYKVYYDHYEYHQQIKEVAMATAKRIKDGDMV